MNLLTEYKPAGKGLRLRQAVPSRDIEFINEWRRKRAALELTENILPKLGVIVEHDEKPVASCFAYMDNSRGIYFLDHFTSKPGTPLAIVRPAIIEGVRFLVDRTGELGYNVALLYTNPRLAKLVKRYIGFQVLEENVTSMIYVNKEIKP